MHNNMVYFRQFHFFASSVYKSHDVLEKTIIGDTLEGIGCESIDDNCSK